MVPAAYSPAPHLSGIFRPGPFSELSEGHDIASICPACVIGIAPVHLGFEDALDRMEELFNAALYFRVYAPESTGGNPCPITEFIRHINLKRLERQL
jgi:hypothetical protein